jgi:membrane dipeptidase
MPEGLEDVSKYPQLIKYLIEKHGWTDEEIVKLMGGNVLRVLEENERVRDLKNAI